MTNEDHKTNVDQNVAGNIRRTVVRKVTYSASLKTKAGSGRYVAITAEELIEAYNLTKKTLADTIGVSLQTLSRPESLNKNLKAQNQLRELGIILHRVEQWTGSADQAYAWFLSEPIPAWGYRTSKQVFGDKDGPKIINRHLDLISEGGFS